MSSQGPRRGGEAGAVVVEVGNRTNGFGCLYLVVGVPVAVVLSTVGIGVVGRLFGWW